MFVFSFFLFFSFFFLFLSFFFCWYDSIISYVVSVHVTYNREFSTYKSLQLAMKHTFITDSSTDVIERRMSRIEVNSHWSVSKFRSDHFIVLSIIRKPLIQIIIMSRLFSASSDAMLESTSIIFTSFNISSNF